MSIKNIIFKEKNKINYNLIIVCISFKLNNIFISINEFTKFLEIFTLNKLLKSYSCGMSNFKNKNKNSLKAYNSLSQKLKTFLLSKKIYKIYLVIKSSKKLKYIFLNILLHNTYNCEFIKISNIYLKLSTPFNGCKLQKHKFL